MIQQSSVLNKRNSATGLAAPKSNGNGRLARQPVKPLLVFLTLATVVIAMAVLFQMRSRSRVTLPGSLYPVAFTQLTATITRGGKVAEVFKHHGEHVKSGEPILRYDSVDEEMLLEQARKRIQSIERSLEGHAKMRVARGAMVELAKAQALEAASNVEAQKALLEEAEALLNREKAQTTGLEVRVAEQKLRFALTALQEAQTTYDQYKAVPPTVFSDEELRLKKLAIDKAQSLVQQAQDTLSLLKTGDIVSRLDTAKAKVAYQQALLKTAQATLETSNREVKIAELQEEIDRRARILEGDLENARLEECRLKSLIAEKTLLAPIDGVLESFHAQPGEWVSNRQPLGWVWNTASLIFQGQARQGDLVRLRPGQKALVYLDANVGICEAEVVEIGSMLSATPEAIDPLGLILQLPARVQAPLRGGVKLKILADSKDHPLPDMLRVGMSGRAEVHLGDGR